MRIVHYLARFRLEDGGVVRAVIDCAVVMARQGHDVQVLTWDPADVPLVWNEARAGQPVVVPLPVPAWPGGFLGCRQLAEIESVIGGADVLHLHGPWDRVNLQLARLARRFATPYVVTAHGMLNGWSMAQKAAKKRAYLAVAGRRLLEQAAFVHCTASGELEQAAGWLPQGRRRVIPCVFDLDPFRALPGPELARQGVPALATGDPVVLFMGRLHPQKRPEVLLDAVAALRDQGRRLTTLVAGTGEAGYLRALGERVRARGLEDRVTFLGLVVGEEKLSLLQAADVMVLPSTQESFGFVLAEALACGTPVITTRGTDIWAELERGGGGLVVDGDAAAVAQGIASLLNDPAGRAAMGARGRDWVFGTLDPEVVAKEFDTMYRDARC